MRDDIKRLRMSELVRFLERARLIARAIIKETVESGLLSDKHKELNDLLEGLDLCTVSAGAAFLNFDPEVYVNISGDIQVGSSSYSNVVEEKDLSGIKGFGEF